jgi:adenylate kinase family enzyme
LGVPGCGKGTQASFLAAKYGFSVISVGEILRKNRDKVITNDGMTIGSLIKDGNLLPDEVVVGCVRDEMNRADAFSEPGILHPDRSFSKPSESDLMEGDAEHRAAVYLSVHQGDEYKYSSTGSTPQKNDYEAFGKRSIIFDGFPRTLGQAKALAVLLDEIGLKDGYVLNFSVSDDLISKRILGRYTCKKCGKIYNDFFLNPEIGGVCDVCGHKEFDRRSDDNEVSLKKRLLEYREKTEILIDYYQELGVLYNIDAAASFDNVSADVVSILGLSKEEK